MTKTKKILWLDDLRNPYIDLEGRVPKEEGIVEWVLNYNQFTLMYGLLTAKIQ